MERIAIQQCQIVLTLVNRSYRSTNLAKKNFKKFMKELNGEREEERECNGKDSSLVPDQTQMENDEKEHHL